MIDFRLLRGGFWVINPRGCRSAYRYNLHFDDRLDNVGFRVCCSSKGNDHTITLKEQTDD